MKSVFKFIFNVIRNLSLIFVIGMIGLSIYFATNEEAANNLLASLENENRNQFEQTNEDEEDEGFGIMAIDEPSLESYKSKKFKIGVKGGFAYLRPSQIMYINSNPIELVMTDETRIEPKMTLYELEELLKKNDEECFFGIRTAIINCNYVLQLAKESTKHNGNYSYQHVVIMEDGERINISKSKANELFEILDNMTF